MSKVMDRLTEKDLSLIYNRRMYAADGTNVISNEEFLRDWAEAKDVFLGDLFQDGLIIETPFKYEQSESALEREFDMAYRDDSSVIRSYLNVLRRMIDLTFPWEITYQLSHRLITSDSLAKNCQKVDTFKVDFPNGKTFTFQKGSRLIRSITKIANALDIDKELTQQFVNEHSRLLNQKELHGTLCLSIHPMDYMTMSDNREAWGSCMSWDEDGEYRVGTLEMMNSNCVVVAYLKSDRKYLFGWERDSWNSKKWRCLFVVNNQMIASVKSYPYNNDSITVAVMNKLREMLEQAYGYHYTEPKAEGSSKTIYMAQDEKEFKFRMWTDEMYNDFGCASSHFVSINNDFEFVNQATYDINYSGKARCIVCGGNIYDHDTLMCNSCDPRYICTCCGERYTSEEEGYFDEDGEWWCESCYHDNHVQTLPYDDYHAIDNCSAIYIDVPDRTREIIDMPYFYVYDWEINQFNRDYGEFHNVEHTYNGFASYTQTYKAIWFDQIPQELYSYNGMMNMFYYSRNLDRFVAWATGETKRWD